MAALAVGTLHASQIFGVSASPFPAYLAVDFFFCLSGFVIAFAYDDRLVSGMNMLDFSLRRVIRLYPMIFIGILLGLVSTAGKLTLAGGHGMATTFGLAISALLLLPAGLFLHLQAFPIDNPIWSLFFEIFANGIYAVQKKYLDVSRVKYLGILFMVGLVLAEIIHRSGSVASIGFNGFHSFLYGFLRVVFSFFFGVAIFRFSISFEPFRLPSGLIILGLGCLLFEPFGSEYWAYDIFCIGLAFPLIVIFGAGTELKAFPVRIMALFGNVSYPFYIIHQPIIRIVHGLMFKLGHVTVPPIIGAMIALVIAAMTSYGFLSFYDEPTRAVLTRLFMRKSLIKGPSKLPA